MCNSECYSSKELQNMSKKLTAEDIKNIKGTKEAIIKSDNVVKK